MGFRCAPRTQATRRRAGIGFRSARSTFVALRAFHRATIEPAEADPRPSMRITRPFRGHLHESARPHAGPTTRRPSSRRAAHASSHGLRSPYGTCQRGGSLCWRRIPSPPRAAYGVWLPPSRRLPQCVPTRGWVCTRRLSAPHACQRDKHAGAPMGFPLQGVSLDRDRCSSRSPYPPAVHSRVRPPPEGRKHRREAVFRVLIPRRVRSSPGHRKASLPTFRQPIPSWGFTSPELAPA
jgi:hypothetical protein